MANQDSKCLSHAVETQHVSCVDATIASKKRVKTLGPEMNRTSICASGLNGHCPRGESVSVGVLVRDEQAA